MVRLPHALSFAAWILLALVQPLWAHDEHDHPDLELKPRIELSADYRHYDPRNLRPSGPTLDRALFGFEATTPDALKLEVLGDARGVDSHGGLALADLSAERSLPRLRLRASAGLLPVVTGLEQETLRRNLVHTQYGFPAFVTGYQAWGAQGELEWADGLVYARAGGTSAEGFDLLGQPRREPGGHIKLATFPLREAWAPLRGFWLSAALLRSSDYRGHLDIADEMRNTLFHTPRLRAGALQARHLGYGLDLGRWRLTHEFARASLLDLETPGGRRDLEDQIAGWSAGLSFRSSGSYDSRPFRRGYPIPRLREEALARGGLGRWEIGLRYANGDIARELILMNFTRYDESSQEFRSLATALTWMPFYGLRWRLQVRRLLADQHPAQIAFKGRDTSALLGLELSF